MIRTAQRQEIGRLRDVLGRANDAPYDITAVAGEKCFGEGVAGTPRVRVFERDRLIRGVAVTCGRYLRLLAVDRNYRNRGIGSALLDDSGASIIAAEAGNYFLPGVLEPRFFLERGFVEESQTWNLGVRWRQPLPSKAPASPPRSDMLDFVEHHFGRAWRFEEQRARIAHYIDSIGFAVAEANNRGLGTFGPMGVAKEHRGKGYGRQLLLACLDDLRTIGFEHVIIPWTDAIDFYRKSCGAEPAHEFVILRRAQ